MEKIKNLILLFLAIFFILAGFCNWDFPLIFWYLRETRFGHIINRIAMITLGIILVFVIID